MKSQPAIVRRTDRHTHKPDPGGGVYFRSLYRSLKARWFPLAFARWVNWERCYIEINNDPSGIWSVTIGIAQPAEGKNLGRAMLAAKRNAEALPDWKWTTEYLRSL